MKIIIFIGTLLGLTITSLNPLDAQVIATGHISAEIVGVNNLSFSVDPLKKKESNFQVNTKLILADPNQTFLVGELIISDEGNLSENSVNPFFISDPDGNKIEIMPSLKFQNIENRKRLQLKAKIPFLPEKKKNYKGYYSIVVNYN
jgi:hypothetical protein